MTFLSQASIWTPQGAEDFDLAPCGNNCAHIMCLRRADNNCLAWECSHGAWYIPEALPANVPSYEPCYRVIRSWADQVEAEFEAMLAAETTEERAARLAAAEEDKRKGQENRMNYMVGKKTDKWCGKTGEVKFRVPKPCDYASLYAGRVCARCLSAVPEGQTTCQAKASGWKTAGKDGRKLLEAAAARAREGLAPLPRPQSHAPCDETFAGCWAHESSHSCIYVHPDEKQWSAACDGTLRYSREQQVFHLEGELLEVPNRFAVAAREVGNGRRCVQSQARQEEGGWQSAGGTKRGRR